MGGLVGKGEVSRVARRLHRKRTASPRMNVHSPAVAQLLASGVLEVAFDVLRLTAKRASVVGPQAAAGDEP